MNEFIGCGRASWAKNRGILVGFQWLRHSVPIGGLWGLALSLVMASSWGHAETAPRALMLNRAVELAYNYDPWLESNRYSQQAMLARAEAALSLPNPKISLTLANFPTDSFDFNQEPMTQFRVAASQQFARGDSLVISNKKFQLLSSQFPYQRQDRRAKVAVMVSRHWLEAYQAQESIVLIETNRALFEQLVDLAQSRYSSAVGRSRQQDLIRAQLELTRLEDRLVSLEQAKDQALADLSVWIGGDYIESDSQNAALGFSQYKQLLAVDNHLPDLERSNSKKDVAGEGLEWFLRNHPVVKALDRQIAAREAEVELCEQDNKIQWGVNIAYGLRNDLRGVVDRPDFLSLGVDFDLPAFTSNRQDSQLQAALAGVSVGHAQKKLLLKKLHTSFYSTRIELKTLTDRQLLYEGQLLPQMREQSEALLTAYTYDDGDFSEVVQSRIEVLNTQIETLNIVVDRQKSIAKLNYFYVAGGSGGAFDQDAGFVDPLGGFENE